MSQIVSIVGTYKLEVNVIATLLHIDHYNALQTFAGLKLWAGLIEKCVRLLIKNSNLSMI